MAVFTTKTVSGGAPGPAARVFSGGEETDGGQVARRRVIFGCERVKMSLFADLRHDFGKLWPFLWQK